MKTTAVKKAPKWGTEAWITTYPWSKMDKDRRRRVRKELGLNGNPEILEVVDRLAKLVKCTVGALSKRCYYDMSAADVEELKSSVECLYAFANRSVNSIIACELARKWHLTCDGECTDHCKSGKCTCKGKCKKAKNR